MRQTSKRMQDIKVKNSNLRAAVRAVSLVRPVSLFFSLCRAVWFVIEQIKIEE